MILAMVQDVIMDEDFELFKLRKEEMAAVVEALQEFSRSCDDVVTILGYSFDPEEILFSMKRLLLCKENQEMLAQMDIVSSFAAFMQCPNSAVKILACHVMLILLMESNSFKEIFLSSDMPLLQTFRELAQSAVLGEKNIALSVLEELGHSHAKGEIVDVVCTQCMQLCELSQVMCYYGSS